MPRHPTPKEVLYSLIPPPRLTGGTNGHAGTEADPYRLLSELVTAHHPHLAEARIALAWRYGWRTDRDNRLTLGRCVRATDLGRELAPWDFVILLNHDAWATHLTPPQRAALLDHELSHCDVLTTRGEPRRDVDGRILYRLRAHDVAEFAAVIKRHGFYTRDLEHFAAECARQAQENPGLFDHLNDPDAGPVTVTLAEPA